MEALRAEIEIKSPMETVPEAKIQTERAISAPIKLDLKTEKEAIYPKKRIFDEFFVVGVAPSSFESVEIRDTTYLPPSILLQYPNLPINAKW